MLKRIKKIFLSRATVLFFIITSVAVVLVGVYVPQRVSKNLAEIAQWKFQHPLVAPLVETLGLDHVYTTPWFALLLLMALASLVLSSIDQLKAALRKTFGPAALPSAPGMCVDADSDTLAGAMRRGGYLDVSSPVARRFVKHPWGFWGNFLLHLGMVVTIGASLFIAFTQQRASLPIAEYQIVQPDITWSEDESGLLAKSLVLPFSVRLVSVRYEFWPDNSMKQVYSVIQFWPDQEKHTVHVSSKLVRDGIRIYQGPYYGETFFLEFTDDKGVKRPMSIQMRMPKDTQTPSYEEMILPWDANSRMKALYYTDAERKSMQNANPELSLQFERLTGEGGGSATLRKGDTVQLGPYRVRLLKVFRWSVLVFVVVKGLPVVFAGFFVMILGAGISYFTPPREFIAVKMDSEYEMHWRASRFKGFYIDERDKILEDLGVTRETDG
ncbi:MAG: cytochrome c biogenesis protein ResB [Thermodesulfovibrionales bacterium]|nr:cytochrome c biogenesis protein ResB [Thermodesulfovibrionales bacterium]